MPGNTGKRAKPQLDRTGQRGLFEGLTPATPGVAEAATESGKATFRDPSPEGLYVGGVALYDYLVSVGQAKAIEARALLRALDWSAFEANYRPGGRPPYAPQSVVGLVVFGALEGVDSLRGLERFAATNLQAWWITGGLTPDHATIGKILVLHQDLVDPLFEQLTTEILKRTKSDCKVVAGDGTVIQAAGSRYRTLKKEAAARAAEEARARADASPNMPSFEEAAQQAERVAEVAEERSEARRAQGKGKEADRVRVCAGEPEAPIQKQKNGGFAPSYRASATANADRVILSADLHPTSENAVVPDLLDQADRVARAATGEGIEDVLLDANYNNPSTLRAALDRDMNPLVPEGQAFGTEIKNKASKLFSKPDFDYDASSDDYVCPQGHRLRRIGQGAERKRLPVVEGGGRAPIERRYVKYGGAPCTDCPLREKCTTAKRGRQIKRYEDDDLKEAARQMLGFESARVVYKQRKGMIEPVFSDLSGRQGFRRFRRKGLAPARFELVLHATAHNLGRYLARAEKGRLEEALDALLALLRSPAAFASLVPITLGAVASAFRSARVVRLAAAA